MEQVLDNRSAADEVPSRDLSVFVEVPVLIDYVGGALLYGTNIYTQ